MPNYRRYLIPGGTYFFTVVTASRAKILTSPQARALLRNAFRTVRQELPFRFDAIVLLLEHLHALWTLPPDDADYSRRWGKIKKGFTRHFSRRAAASSLRRLASVSSIAAASGSRDSGSI